MTTLYLAQQTKLFLGDLTHPVCVFSFIPLINLKLIE